MGSARLEQMNGEADFWKQMAGASLTNLYAFRQAIITIRHRYFDGVELLFPDLDRSLIDLTKHTEELVTLFNDQVIKKSEDKINIEALHQGAGKIVAERVSYLVDMAKAEALDAVGENRAAVELIQRHLEA
jgi:predicted metal-dependent hydrolase